MITLYTSHCPKCEILKKKLDDANVEYQVFDDVEKMIAMGFTVMPMLDDGDKTMAFSDAVKWVNEKKEV